jgi:hypothetical protein
MILKRKEKEMKKKLMVTAVVFISFHYYYFSLSFVQHILCHHVAGGDYAPGDDGGSTTSCPVIVGRWYMQ